MSNGEIDRLPVNQLTERYGLVRSAVYTRMDALGIKPERIGNKSYVNADQIRLLDELHEFIQRGGTTAEFQERYGLPRTGSSNSSNSSSSLSSEQSSGLSAIQPDIIELITRIAAEIASRFQPSPVASNPLAYFEMAYFEVLERAAQGGWLLKNSEVGRLLDIAPSELQLYSDSFSEAGFTFTKAGYRKGEVAWRVSKPLK